MPQLNILCEDRLTDIDECADEIEDKLSSLKTDKAAGDDNMSPWILKVLSKEIASPIALIFCKSLDNSQVPRHWRTANVSPLFKKCGKHQVDNYRPVSLTSQVCKIVEAIIRNKTVCHLDKNNLIRNSQHGFRKGYSCASNLLVFLESVTASIDAKQNVDTIYLDLAKAFDEVPHNRLIQKLKVHGTDVLICNSIISWLTDRWQRVVCLDGSHSSWK